MRETPGVREFTTCAENRAKYGHEWKRDRDKARAERDKAIAENKRLRELYENVTGNRERFGWTINHLLECEEALRTVEGAAAEAITARDAARKALAGLLDAARPWLESGRSYAHPACHAARQILSEGQEA